MPRCGAHPCHATRGSLTGTTDRMTTHCNMSHCAWWDALQAAVRFEPVDPLAWQKRGTPELAVAVRAAGAKGLGVFAKQDAGPGRWVCEYVGETLSLSQLLARYRLEPPVYVYRLSATRSIDARNSSHFSRYINHDASPNLQVSVDRARQRIDIFAKRPLRVGTELTIDYGLSYWRARSDRPTEATDSRLVQHEHTGPSFRPAWPPWVDPGVQCARALDDSPR